MLFALQNPAGTGDSLARFTDAARGAAVSAFATPAPRDAEPFTGEPYTVPARVIDQDGAEHCRDQSAVPVVE